MTTRFNNNQVVQTATIANGGTVSTAVSLEGTTLVGIAFPAGLTTGTARFQVSLDGVTYLPLNDDLGNRVSVPAVASTANSLKPSVFAGWPFVKVDMASAVGADRIIQLLSRPV